jgi:DNA-directed RNA polymerase specialized sigma24 family protein
MTETLKTQWPAIESAYTDEFGPIDPEVYEAAGEVWAQAEMFALNTLGDAAAGLRLMLKAVASVSRVRAQAAVSIRELSPYIFKTYTRLVVAERQKENGHRRLAEVHSATPLAEEPAETERRVLLHEVMGLMDGWTRRVFEWRCLGHDFAEIACWIGTSENAARNKFNHQIKSLAERVSGKRPEE